MNYEQSGLGGAEDPAELGAFVFLAMLLLGDLGFIAAHCVHHLTLFGSVLLSLSTDRGYAEMFQYVKWAWIILLLAVLSIRQRSSCDAVWIPLFTYFLLDDALMLHELLGGRIAAELSGSPPFGLRTQDIGELMVSAMFFLLWLPLFAATYLRNPGEFRRKSHDFLLLLSMLAFFGVAVDILHSMMGPVWKTTFVVGAVPDGSEMLSVIFDMVEDGGEMVAASLITCYAYLLAVRDGRPGRHLCDRLRQALHWRVAPATEVRRPVLRRVP